MKMADKLQKDGKPFSAMVFPQVMQSQLIAFDSAKYIPMFSSAMAQGLNVVNPLVPNPNTTSPKTKEAYQTQTQKAIYLKVTIFQKSNLCSLSKDSIVVK